MNLAENVPHPDELGTISFHAHAVVVMESRVICDVAPQRWTPMLESKSAVSSALLVNGTSSVGSAPAESVDLRAATTMCTNEVGLLDDHVMNMRPSAPET